MPTPSKPHQEPPLYTLLMELTGWTLDRTADIPKNARFTFGQRVDNLTLDALCAAVRALRSPAGSTRQGALKDLDLMLEQLRVLWRLVSQRRWISQQQLMFAARSVDEIGRMDGAWLKAGESKVRP
jgi:hypothetical protein